jgi:muconolactone delta-isomerase
MNTYIVMARFIPGTNMQDVLAVVGEEQAQVAVLTAEGRLGAVHISMPRQTVFIEVFGDDEAVVESTIRSLPMAQWWTLDIYPTPPPALPQVAL